MIQPQLQLFILYDILTLQPRDIWLKINKMIPSPEKISTDSKTKPGLELIKQLLLNVQYIKLPYRPSIGQQLILLKEIELNETALHWAIKLEWNRRHKIPGKRTYTRTAKPLGEFFQQVFLLCEKCHGRQASVGYKLPYSNAEHWFQIFYQEWITNGMTQAFSLVAQTKPNGQGKIKKPDADKKRSTINACLKVCHTASQLQNPFQDGSSFSKLLDVAIKLAESSQNFKEDYYQPFIKAWRNMIKAFDEPEFKRHWVEGDTLYYQQGRGNDTKKAQYQKGDSETLTPQ
jgi:hypothetical protein